MNIISFVKNKIRPVIETDNGSTVNLTVHEKVPKSAASTTSETKNGSWTWPIESVFALVGYNVNLISVWTFPALCMKHGGIAFMIPCLISLILVVIPLYYIEISLGQRSGRGIIKMWHFVPLFQGIGWASLLITTLVAIYHSVHVAWCIYYLAASFTSRLPWSDCFLISWRTPKCSLYPPNFTLSEISTVQNVSYQYGLIQTTILNDSIVVVNKSYPGFPDVWRLPADEYFNNQVLKLANGFSGNNGLDYELVFCLFLGLLICMISLIRGMKSGGKVLIFMVTVPYCILLAIFVRALLTDGASIGLKQFIYPNWKKLRDVKVWSEAGLVMFFMNFVSWGNVATIASYNGKKHSKFADAFIAPLVGFIYAIVFGLVVASLVGILSNDLHVPIENLITTGPNFLFVTVAQGVTKLKMASLWSALLFFCLLNISMSSLIVLLETIIKALNESSCKLLSKRCLVSLVLCIIIFFSSFGLVSKKGYFIVLIFQNYSTWWNILFLAFLELVIAAIFYNRISDCEMQIVSKFCRRAAFGQRLHWMIKCAIVLVLLIIYSLVTYRATVYGQFIFPHGIDAIGWKFTCLPLVSVLIIGLIVVFKSGGASWKEKFKTSIQAYPTWPSTDDQRDERRAPMAVMDPEMREIQEKKRCFLEAGIAHEPQIAEENTSSTTVANKPSINIGENLPHYGENEQFQVIQKIAAVEYATKPGKVNRPTQMTIDVHVQTGEDGSDDNERKGKKHKHRHSRRKNKDKAPSHLPPLALIPVGEDTASKKHPEIASDNLTDQIFQSTIENNEKTESEIEKK